MKIKVRPRFSYSQMSAFKYSQARFIRNYYYGEEQSSVYMDLGKQLGTALQFRNKATLPVIINIRERIPEAKVYEKELKVTFNGIPCVGYLDGWDGKKFEILEFKTGKTASEKSWTDQMKFYGLLIWQKYKRLPSKITLYWARTEFNDNDQLVLTGEVRKYDIKVTMNDVIQFSSELVKTYNEIQKLVELEYSKYGILPVKMVDKRKKNKQNNKTK